MTFSTGIYFEKRESTNPQSKDVTRIYNAFEKMIARFDIKPNWFCSTDGRSDGKYRKFGGRHHQKILADNFQGSLDVTLAVAPLESVSPGYDSFIDFGFIFSDVSRKAELSVVIDEPYIRYNSSATNELVMELSQLWSWDFGYAIERASNKSIGMYMGGGITNQMSPSDRENVEKWYFSSHKPESRLVAVRDIFVYNMIGLSHLNYQLPSGNSVRHFIEDDPNSSLTTLTDDLWLWKVEENKIMATRQKLLGTGFIITE